MNALTDEQLDVELAHLPYPDGDREFDDGLLHRYRRGDLDETNTARVERLLLESPRARAVLAESARPVEDDLIRRLEKVVTPERPQSYVAPRIGLAMVVVALAASVVAIVLRPVDPDFAPRIGLSDIAGHVKDVRSADNALQPEEVPTVPQFVPDSQVKLVLHTLEGNSGGVPSIRSYRVDPDGRLMAAPGAKVTRGNAGARIEGRAGDVIGEAPGLRRLHVVFSPADAPLDMVGRSPDEARALVCGTCWMTIDVEMLPRE